MQKYEESVRTLSLYQQFGIDLIYVLGKPVISKSPMMQILGDKFNIMTFKII